MIKRNWLIVPLVIIGFYYNFWRIKNADTEMIFQEIFFGFLLFLFLIFLGFSLNKDFKKFKISKSWKSYFPSLIGLLILVSFGVTSLVLDMRDNSPTIIHAGYDGDFNGAWFEFREDGTYKFVDHAGIGADITRGNYQMKDSIIILDKSTIGNVIVSNKLAIRIDSTGEKKMFQIDEKHSVVNDKFKLIINDNIEN
ncbi:hypothetical protein [Chryseobacterium foetidum]|uniref:hypothetical protein n=1 Tax=Chryseobacterium foetidum TaxID=2951057 RepID=UPI0021C84E61|nr:hypothetical protein [Chryseobacterium foetidum]